MTHIVEFLFIVKIKNAIKLSNVIPQNFKVKEKSVLNIYKS